MATRKKKGPGRPKLTPDQRTQAVTFSVRMPVEMKARLDAAVAKKDRKDWKLNTEVVKRLERSLEKDALEKLMDAFGGSRTFYLMMLIAETVSSVERVTQLFETRKSVTGEWLDDPFIYAMAVEGIEEILKQIAPMGDPSKPKDMMMPHDLVGASSAKGIITNILLADEVSPVDGTDENGLNILYSDHLKRSALIRKELGPDVISRIGRK